MKPSRERLDAALVQRGLTQSREKARALILAGKVTVGGSKVDKPSAMISADAELAVDAGTRYASRGGLKLAHALDRFGVDPRGRVCLDAGASTGGFTDVLLKRGATRIYAVDVGYGQLSWELRNDPRVVVMERTNVRFLRELPESVEVVTADLSFISLTLVLERLAALASPDADYVLLVKPQFEAGREQVGKGGVVRDRAVHEGVLRKVTEYASDVGLRLHGLTASPVTGPAGNVEFLAWYRRGNGVDASEDAIEAALAEVVAVLRGGAERT